MSQRPFQLCAALLVGVSLLLLPSCDDSSTVGLGVGPDSLEGGKAKRVVAAPALDTTVATPITGLEFQPQQQTWRFLAGRVDDPIAGTIEADAYIDVLGRTNFPDEFFSAEAGSLAAELRFTTSYLHGDSTSTPRVRVLNLSEEADMHQAPADTTFPAESEAITTASITPTDSLVTIELPQSWIEDNLSTLRDTSGLGSAFQENFHGFKLEAVDGNAVTGFAASTATLTLTYTPDSTSVDYLGFKTFTHVERPPSGTAPTVPENRILLQDGLGVNLRMEWDFDANPLDSLENSPLNHAEIYVPVDTSALKAQSGSGTFVRPFPRGFRVLLQQESAEIPVVLDPTAAPGAARVPSTPPANVTSLSAFSLFEQSLIGSQNFNVYRVEVADRTSTSIDASQTLNPGLPSTLPALVPLPEADVASGSPRAILIVTPL